MIHTKHRDDDNDEVVMTRTTRWRRGVVLVITTSITMTIPMLTLSWTSSSSCHRRDNDNVTTNVVDNNIDDDNCRTTSSMLPSSQRWSDDVTTTSSLQRPWRRRQCRRHGCHVIVDSMAMLTWRPRRHHWRQHPKVVVASTSTTMSQWRLYDNVIVTLSTLSWTSLQRWWRPSVDATMTSMTPLSSTMS